MKPKQTLASLTKAEEEVMQIIWQLGRCVVRDIIEHSGLDDVPHSTMSSVVRILEKKGFVDHKAYGKTHEYFPIISREDYAQSQARGLMQRYFGGSAKSLVSFLVEGEDLKLKELNDLMKTLNESQPPVPPKTKTKKP